MSGKFELRARDGAMANGFRVSGTDWFVVVRHGKITRTETFTDDELREFLKDVGKSDDYIKMVMED